MRGLSADGATPVAADLNAVLRQSAQQGCDTFESEFEDFHVELEFDLDESIGEQMLAERDFGEAVINLVSNACLAMRTKLAEIGGEYSPHLNVSSHLADEVVEVRIKDNGHGIQEENLGKIFNPFFTTREGALGAGLRLPIAADVAQRAGGDLVGDTEYGEYAEYAEFTMHIPVVQPEEEVDDYDDEPVGMAEIVERMSAQT